MPKKKERLTDEELLDALVRLGGKVTATELAESLGYKSDRTIRYRIKRLREKGVLGRVWPQTHDVKIGLGDANLILDMSERYRSLPREFLFCFPNFYANYATYGRYTGTSTGVGYPLGNPQIVNRAIRAMKNMGIIKDYFLFHINDYITLAPDFSKYNLKTGWKWNWNDWVKASEKTLKAGEQFPYEFDTNPNQFDYDHKDIEILAEIKMHGAELTYKELSKRIDLSETQIGVRIRRLEEAGVLRGYAWLTEMTPQMVALYTHLELDDPDPVLSCFLHLPFRSEIMIESKDRYLVRLTLNSSDIVQYLKGFEALRPYIRSYFMQTAVSIKVLPGGMHRFYHLHNEATDRWEMPIEDYIQDLEKFIEDY
jgi:DNA-binding Lrp family transcriptional regulator